jgi:ubiquinone/menaquinone biosynthesis C-methylase UbiE
MVSGGRPFLANAIAYARRVSRALLLIGLLTGCAPDRSLSSPEPRAEAVPTPSLHVEPGAETPAEINARYAERDVGRWQRILGAETREVVARRTEIVEALELQAGDDVADIGAGTGAFTFELAARVGTEGRVYAVEVHPDFVAVLREMAVERRRENVQIVSADQASVGLAPASIDLAFVCDVYHHLEHPAASLAGIARALRPGGRLVVIDLSREASADPFIRRHVRAGPEVFRAEIEAAGFRFEREVDLLRENFFFVFRRD